MRYFSGTTQRKNSSEKLLFFACVNDIILRLFFDRTCEEEVPDMGRMKKNVKMTIFLKFLALAIFLMGPSEAFCVDWALYGRPDTGFFLAYYDRDNVVATHEGTLRVTVKYVYTGPGKKEVVRSRERSELPTKGYEILDHSIAQYELNCKTKEQAIFSVNEIDAGGKELDRYNPPARAWTIIKPGGIGEVLLNEICK